LHFNERPPDQVKKFIEISFTRNIPIYLLILIAEDKSMLESLVKVDEIFGARLISRK
jgi:hypothetical protein